MQSIWAIIGCIKQWRNRYGRDRIVVGFTTTHTISAIHH